MNEVTPQLNFLDKVEVALTDLNLGETITREKFPDDGQFTRMGLILSWDDEHSQPGTNERDDVVYTAVMVINRGSTRASADEFRRTDVIRDKMYQRFHNKRIFLDDVTISPAGPMSVKFGTDGLPESWKKNRYTGVIQVIATYRRTRSEP